MQNHSYYSFITVTICLAREKEGLIREYTESATELELRKL